MADFEASVMSDLFGDDNKMVGNSMVEFAAWIAAHPHTRLVTYVSCGRVINYALIGKRGRQVSSWREWVQSQRIQRVAPMLAGR